MSALAGPIVPVADRFHDAAPWKGGDWTNGCTAGDGVRGSNGQAYLLSAAHCFGQGATVSSPTGTVGTVTNTSRNTYGGLDVEQIAGNVTGITWRNNTVQAHQFSSFGDVYGGGSVCKSGSTSMNEQCGTVESNMYDACVPVGYGTGYYCHFNQVDGGSTAVCPGDSGGPNYQVRGDGQLTVMGTTNYASGNQTGSSGNTYTGSQPCYAIWGYTRILAIADPNVGYSLSGPLT